MSQCQLDQTEETNKRISHCSLSVQLPKDWGYSKYYTVYIMHCTAFPKNVKVFLFFACTLLKLKILYFSWAEGVLKALPNVTTVYHTTDRGVSEKQH